MMSSFASCRSFASRVEAQVISLWLRDKGLVSAGHVEGVMALEDECKFLVDSIDTDDATRDAI